MLGKEGEWSINFLSQQIFECIEKYWWYKNEEDTCDFLQSLPSRRQEKHLTNNLKALPVPGKESLNVLDRRK